MVYCRIIIFICLLDFDLGSCCWDLLTFGDLFDVCVFVEGVFVEDR